MSRVTVAEILEDFSKKPPVPPPPKEMDLGPMRLQSSGVCWENGTKKHALTIRVGDSIISIVASPSGASSYVIKDGVRLIEPTHDIDK